MTKAEYITQLDQFIRSTAFNDTQGSSKDPALLGPPTVEFAPFGRTPNSKVRKDARQGTIDQDPEFIEFLEGLTNPIQKATTVDQENDASAKSKEKVTTTPLIQYLRDKKANKGKEASSPAKGSKHTRQDSKDGKGSSSSEKKTPPKPATISSPDKRSAQVIKVENAARDAVKVLNKQATNNKKPASPPVVVPPTVASTSPAPLAEKKRERGNVSAAARILQRDLGLGGGQGRGGRGGRRGGSVTPAKADATPSTSQAQTEAPKTIIATPPEKSQTITQKVTPPETAPQSANSREDATSPQSQTPSSTAVPPTGPAATRNNAKPSPQLRAGKTPPAKTTPTASRTPIVSPTATQAFLKHANPSQGITEPLLEETFSGFGTVTKVEIDKKKGFAYIDFAEPDGLQKAMEASPVKVAQGQVVVLERKSGPTLQARNTRGGPAMAGNRGGSVPMGPRGGRGGSMRRGGGPGRPQVKANDPSTVKTSQASNVHEAVPSAAPVQDVKAGGGASESDTAPPPSAAPET